MKTTVGVIDLIGFGSKIKTNYISLALLDNPYRVFYLSFRYPI